MERELERISQLRKFPPPLTRERVRRASAEPKGRARGGARIFRLSLSLAPPLLPKSPTLRHHRAMGAYQLIYRSRISRRIRFADAEQIAERSAEKNALRNISGLLLYTPTHFLQVLEGDQTKVSRLFERIKNDDRHGEVEIISQGEVDERSFGDWGMRVALPRGSTQPENLQKLNAQETLALLLGAR